MSVSILFIIYGCALVARTFIQAVKEQKMYPVLNLIKSWTSSEREICSIDFIPLYCTLHTYHSKLHLLFIKLKCYFSFSLAQSSTLPTRFHCASYTLHGCFNITGQKGTMMVPNMRVQDRTMLPDFFGDHKVLEIKSHVHLPGRNLSNSFPPHERGLHLSVVGESSVEDDP